MKKSLVTVLALLTAAGTILSGCGSTSSASQTSSKAASSTASGTASTSSKAEDSKTVSSVTASAAASSASGEDKTITVGASPSPHAEILAQVKDILANEGYTLVVKEYTDYVQPNVALAAGDLDANYFQHQPYLDQYNKENGTDLVSAGTIHYEPFGIYAGKTSSISALADGASVGVPNDATNEARALLLLEAQGLIKLKDGAGINATKNDIAENPKNLKITEIEAAQLPRSLQDLDIAVINGNYAIEAGLSVKKDALATEDAASLGAKTYGNIIAVRKGDESSDKIKALVSALQSDTVKTYINNTYDGAVVALF
ncbi:MAG TPA: MetQ/NlpA family ABC transporter substrate-binding protein [Lachnospiraceae bacterium]|nr:MetQ/NlpA family ABC transporter substrate-binding protein [Lachnospiraceae bacterium]